MSLEKEVGTVIEQYGQKEFYTGAVCLVKHQDQILTRNVYGYKNYLKKDLVNMNTIFDLASVSKIVTTTVILRLVTEKKIRLDTTLEDCLPGVKEHPILARTSIKQLLTHSSNLIAWYPFYSELPNQNLYDVLKKIDLLHNENKTVYSDLNFILLGEVIKQTTKMSLQEAIHTYIAEPLEMNSLTYGPLNDLSNVAATEYGNQIEMKMCRDRNKSFDHFRNVKVPIVGEVNDGNCYYFFNGQSGHAGLFANATDVSKLGDLYLKGGCIGGKCYIDASLINQSMQKQVEDRGLGWQLSKPFPSGCGHTGFTGTSIWIDVERNFQVVLLTNRLNVKEPKNINPFRSELFHLILNEIKNN